MDGQMDGQIDGQRVNLKNNELLKKYCKHKVPSGETGKGLIKVEYR